MAARVTAQHGRRFPQVIIRHAVWLYLRFPLSYRDVEELLAQRGIEVSHESIRRWVWPSSARATLRSFEGGR